jgi:hypothetical protein
MLWFLRKNTNCATANCANGINVKSNFYVNADAFHLRSDMRFPHVDQSSLIFNMFVLLPSWTKTAYSVFEIFSPPSFFMGLEVFEEKSKKMNLKTRKDD